MKIIRITAENEATTHEFPKDDPIGKRNDFLRGLIGNNCTVYEAVRLNRLYAVIGASINDVICLVDEEGLLNDLPTNIFGSYLYGSELHGNLIVGTVLIVGITYDSDFEADFSGLSDEQFNLIYPKVCDMVGYINKRGLK